MNYYIDFEFHEHFIEPSFFSKKKVHTIEPIELGIVCENGRGLKLLYNDFDTNSAWYNKWLQANVIYPMYVKHSADSMDLMQMGFNYNWFKDYVSKFGVSKNKIAILIMSFINVLETENKLKTKQVLTNVKELKFIPSPKFFGYYCDYDWVCLCQTFGTMMDLPSNFPMYCIDLKQEFDNKVEELRHSSLNEPQGLLLSFNDYSEYLKSLKAYPIQDNEHCALSDANWNKDLHSFIKGLNSKQLK